MSTIYGFVSWCDADIFYPFVSRQLHGPLNILSNVKQTALPLAVQNNTAPRSTRYTSHTPDPLVITQLQYMLLHLLQTEYKQQPACTGSGSLLYCFNITALWIYNFMFVSFM